MSRFISDTLKSLFKVAPAAANTAETMKPTGVVAAVKATQVLMAPLKPHLPLIRFRKDAAGTATAASASQTQPKAPGVKGQAPPSQPLKPGSTIALPTIEDWQLPQRYRRRPISADEIEYINRGGPA